MLAVFVEHGIVNDRLQSLGDQLARRKRRGLERTVEVARSLSCRVETGKVVQRRTYPLISVKVHLAVQLCVH